MSDFRDVNDSKPEGGKRERKSRLERIVQPLYDTQLQRDSYPIVFFQSPDGRPSSQTNVQTVGKLSWPKRFQITGIQFDFSHPIGNKTAGNLTATIIVGDKRYFSLPLPNFTNRTDVGIGTPRFSEPISVEDEEMSEHQRRALMEVALDGAIYIPPAQHFMVSLGQSGPCCLGGIEIRCTLRGVLFREIC